MKESKYNVGDVLGRYDYEWQDYVIVQIEKQSSGYMYKLIIMEGQKQVGICYKFEEELDQFFYMNYHKYVTTTTVYGADELQLTFMEKPEELYEVKDNGLIDKQEHYKATGIEPINLMFENFTQEEYQGFLQGNILKYMIRYKRKNGLEDLKKAKTYLTWLIEDVEKRGI